MASIAHIATDGSRGVVYADDGKVWSIVRHEPLQPRDADGMNIHMWMQGRPTKEVDAGEHPFDAAYAALNEATEFDRTRGYALRILVLSTDFMVVFADKLEKSKFLSAPISCKDELLEVWRGEEIISTAVITPVGTHGNADGFYGLAGVSQEEGVFVTRLGPSHFEGGSELRIKELPSDTTPEKYWEAMTLESATNQD